MPIGLGLQKAGASDAFVSAGNTGAVLVGSTMLLGLHEGVERATVATLFPTADLPVLVLDAGATVDCSARELVGFAWLGTIYMQDVLGRTNPKVGLLNVGEEDEKGNAAAKEAHGLLGQAQGLNYVGNVEGRDIVAGHHKLGMVDVVVCDGFVGNIVLKFYESVARLIVSLVRKEAPAVLEQPEIQRVFRHAGLCRLRGRTAPRSEGGRDHLPRLLPAQRLQERHPGGHPGGRPQSQRAYRRPVCAPRRGVPGLMQRPFVHIAGLGVFVPARVVTNRDFETRLETSDQWIVERTGHPGATLRGGRTRPWPPWRRVRPAPPLGRAGTYGRWTWTQSSSRPRPPTASLPSTACYLQALIGAERAAAFDLSAACSGFIYGLTIAEGLIASWAGAARTGGGRREAHSITDSQDRSTAILFGDGAGAAVVSRDRHGDRGLLSSFIKSDGRLASLLYIPGGGDRRPDQREGRAGARRTT